MQPADAPRAGLYLHIPFCAAICHYCNFNRGLFDGALKERYVEALEREIRDARLRPVRPGRPSTPRAADTIYFGGGTPSLLTPEDVGRLVTACREAFEVSAQAEITIEANPESATPELLAGYRAAGANRLSVGVQSLLDTELVRLGRMHTAERAVRACSIARDAGFDNLSLDLMMWLPEQSVEAWGDSVNGAVAIAPDHVSMYMLEVYPNAPLRDEMARGGWSLAPDEDAARMYVDGLEAFERAGYQQYEISNVARPGKQSRHNLKYWSDGEWLGFGCGAHSTAGGIRWKNVTATEEYVSRVASGASLVAEQRILSPDEQLGEALFTGLRLTDGVDVRAVERRYGVDVWDRYGGRLEPFLEAGLLVRTSDRLCLTRAGMLLANEVMEVFV